jgi:hypothetical protein
MLGINFECLTFGPHFMTAAVAAGLSNIAAKTKVLDNKGVRVLGTKHDVSFKSLNVIQNGKRVYVCRNLQKNNPINEISTNIKSRTCALFAKAPKTSEVQ